MGMNIFRVRFSHEDPEHHVSEPAFYGPAFDAGYENTIREALGVDTVDLLGAAQTCAERCRDEHPDADGYTTVVVELQDNGDGTSEWEEVG